MDDLATFLTPRCPEQIIIGTNIDREIYILQGQEWA